jgi:alkylation response protein AidB-like acyl-CoA dehydrogenase
VTRAGEGPGLRADQLASWAGRFPPIFGRIQDNALRHEHERSLPYDEVRWLAEAGFGALCLPAADGGGGASVTEFFALLTGLAAADSNHPQIWRNNPRVYEERLVGAWHLNGTPPVVCGGEKP